MTGYFATRREIDADIYLPADLYRRNAKGIAGYLFNGAMARGRCGYWRGRFRRWRRTVARLTTGVVFKFPIAEVDDLNTLSPKLDPSQIYNARAMVAAFTRATAPQRRIYLTEGYNEDEMVRNFERDAIALIEQHPDVTFDIYFTPYSILQFVAMRDFSPATLEIAYRANSYMLRRLAQFPNVKVYDFRDAKGDHARSQQLFRHDPSIAGDRSEGAGD